MMITIIVPEGHITKANHLGMALGFSEADGLSYPSAAWEDAAGNLYATTSLMSEQFVASPLAPLERPDWDVEGIVNMTEAQQAQSMLVLYTPSEDEDQPDLTGQSITVIRGPLPLDALALMGIVPVPRLNDN